MDLDLTQGAVHCASPRTGQAGVLLDRAHYRTVAGPLQVEVSQYMGTAMVAGDFGHLNIVEGAQEVTYDAVQVHVAAPSLHTVNGTAYDAELIIMHKPRGNADMLQKSVAVSILFSTSTPVVAGQPDYSNLLHELGFHKEVGLQFDDHTKRLAWNVSGPIELASELQKPLAGASYLYNGSVPVPPCTESVKWIVLGSPQHVRAVQIQHLKELLSSVREHAPTRTPAQRNRCISVNSADIGGSHEHHTCELDHRKGTWLSSARCWDDQDRCWSKRYSATDIDTAGAVEPTPEHPLLSNDDLVHYKTVDHITVSPSSYSLDAHVDNHGSFGHLLLNGHIYFAKNVSFKAISQHTINGARSEGELMIEHVMFGDTFGEGLPGYQEDLHKVIISIPLKMGPESSILRKLGLTESTSRSIQRGLEYHISDASFDLAAELQPPLSGRWFWYSSNSTHKDCGTSVRWMVFETPLSISFDQLNMLRLPVSGVDSSQYPRPVPAGHVWRQHLPADAVEANETECENLPLVDWKYGQSYPHWDYGNERCWNYHYPICGAGEAQSPIDVPVSSIAGTGADNFLHKCSWKPVADLRVENTGHGIQVTSNQFGYVSFIDEAGYPDYYQVLQFHLHMPSEHMIGGKQYAAELHIVHSRQKTVLDMDPEHLLVTAIMFDLGDEDSPVLKQLFLSNGTQAIHHEGDYQKMKRPFDPMRSFGPVIDGPYYRYDGSLTTPPCSEVVKWFVFERPLTMSRQQWLAYKHMYPNPNNNRPVQSLNGRKVMKNSFEQGTAKDYQFFLNRDMARDRRQPNAWLIAFPIIGTIVLCSVVMASTFVREERKIQLESAGGLAQTIGKAEYDRL